MSMGSDAHPPRPSGLSSRILATFGGLVVVYVALVAALVISGISGLIVGAGAIVLAVVQLRASDRLLLSSLDAAEVTPEDAPDLHAAVSRLCVQADLPRPRVAISDSGMATALAVGGLGRRATVCVDRRLIEMLEPAELEAVVAHEIAHLAHRDVLVMTLASFFSIVAALLTRLATQGGLHIVRGVAIVAAPIAWGMSTLLLRALSRYRELAADRTAAALTGRPSALASALMKVDAAAAKIPTKDLRSIRGVAALGIVAFPGRTFRSRLMATHPTTRRRVAELHALELELQSRRPYAR